MKKRTLLVVAIMCLGVSTIALGEDNGLNQKSWNAPNGNTITITETTTGGVVIEGTEGKTVVDKWTVDSYKAMLDTAEHEHAEQILTAQFVINNGSGAVDDDTRTELWKKSQEATQKWAQENPEQAMKMMVNGGDSYRGESSYNTFYYNATGEKVATEDLPEHIKENYDIAANPIERNPIDPEGWVPETPNPENPIEKEEGTPENPVGDPENGEGRPETGIPGTPVERDPQAAAAHLQQTYQTDVATLNSRIDHTRSEMKGIGAQSAALTASTVMATQNLEVGEVGVGVGHGSYSDANAQSISLGTKISEDMSVTAGWSHSDSNSDMWNAGFGYKFNMFGN